ncbi:MAG TPA: hypothetical protein VN894_00895 [Polyangiaceae bacterium]|nr:hypothetical protein [Polyangiaceae bacterium]
MHRPLTIIALVLLPACGKEDATGSSAPAASSSPPSASALAAPSAATAISTASSAASAAADAPPPPKCPAGLTPNAVPAYCIKLPASYSVKQVRSTPKRGSVEYDTGSSTDNLMITYDESPIPQLAKDVESEMKFGGDKLDKKGNLPGGNKWFQGTHGDYARLVTLVKGQGSLTLKCSFAYQPKKAPPKEAIDACRSIAVP